LYFCHPQSGSVTIWENEDDLEVNVLVFAEEECYPNAMVKQSTQKQMPHQEIQSPPVGRYTSL
jgi:hypothetical protein